MKNLNDGEIHKLFFSRGKLYLDGTQIGGEGISPEKDIAIEFKTNLIPAVTSKPNNLSTKDPSVLEINVKDSVSGGDIGPGQR